MITYPYDIVQVIEASHLDLADVDAEWSVLTADGQTLVVDRDPRRTSAEGAIPIYPGDGSGVTPVGSIGITDPKIESPDDAVGSTVAVDLDPTGGSVGTRGGGVPIGMIVPGEGEGVDGTVVVSSGESTNDGEVVPIGMNVPGSDTPEDDTIVVTQGDPEPLAPNGEDPTGEIKGVIRSVSRNADGVPVSFLVEGAPGSPFDKAVIYVVTGTRVVGLSDGSRQQVGAITEGAAVLVRFSGPVRESYPVQIDGTEVWVEVE